MKQRYRLPRGMSVQCCSIRDVALHAKKQAELAVSVSRRALDLSPSIRLRFSPWIPPRNRCLASASLLRTLNGWMALYLLQHPSSRSFGCGEKNSAQVHD